MPENQIGSFLFIRLAGSVGEPGRTSDRYERRGFDGADYRQAGRRVVRSVVRTVVDLADQATCQTTYRAYRAAQNGDPVTVYDANGLAWPDVIVRDVVLDEGQPYGAIHPLETPVGGINSGDWLLHCVWTLESIYLP
jgi:hypothetical protein